MTIDEQNSIIPPIFVNRQLKLDPKELLWRFSASGGPGGQHANTSNTKATVVFDIENSLVLNEQQREVLNETFGRQLIVSSSSQRSQLQNRVRAQKLLVEKIAEALHKDPTRFKTKPSRSSQRRRLDSKSKESIKKSHRRRVGHDD